MNDEISKAQNLLGLGQMALTSFAEGFRSFARVR